MKLPEKYHPLFFKREITSVNGEERLVLRRVKCFLPSRFDHPSNSNLLYSLCSETLATVKAPPTKDMRTRSV